MSTSKEFVAHVYASKRILLIDWWSYSGCVYLERVRGSCVCFETYFTCRLAVSFLMCLISIEFVAHVSAFRGRHVKNETMRWL